MTYCNAGHLLPLLLRATGDAVWLDRGGPVVGLLPATEYQSDTVRLAPDDLLIFYTDGLVDAEDDVERPFGTQNLESAVRSQNRSSSGEILESIQGSVTEFRGSGTLEDDMTLIVAKVSSPRRARLAVENAPGQEESVHDDSGQGDGPTRWTPA